MPRRASLLWPRRSSGVDTHDAGSFRVAARRARLLRLVCGGAAVVLLAAAVASARDLETHTRTLLPTGATGVVVLDLSLSIADEDYRNVRRAFRRVIAENSPVGLVVFSDVPYELLPPGTPARELRPLLRLLVPPRIGSPVNPWSSRFRAGTRISTALELARDMLERDRVTDGAILLVSDLETAPTDVAALTRTIAGLARDSIAVRVVPLSASSDALLIFGGLIVEDAIVVPRSGEEEQLRASPDAGRKPPLGLLVLGVSFFVALAAYERFAGRLALPQASGRRGAQA